MGDPTVLVLSILAGFESSGGEDGSACFGLTLPIPVTPLGADRLVDGVTTTGGWAVRAIKKFHI